MNSVAPLHGDAKATPIFSSPAHCSQWETKCAFAISVDDEFPGTRKAMVASGAEAVAAQVKAPSSSCAVTVPVVAHAPPGQLVLHPAKTSCKQLQN